MSKNEWLNAGPYKDEHCVGCIYYAQFGSGSYCCDYWSIEDKRRPCKPGKDCTVKVTGTKKRISEFQKAARGRRISNLEKQTEMHKEAKKEMNKENLLAKWDTKGAWNLYLEGKNPIEISETLGIKYSTLRSYMNRYRWAKARDNMRDLK